MDSLLEALEAKTSVPRRGLWTDPDPVALWEFRKAFEALVP